MLGAGRKEVSAFRILYSVIRFDFINEMSLSLRRSFTWLSFSMFTSPAVKEQDNLANSSIFEALYLNY